MRISYTWLKEMVAVDLEPRVLAEKLTMAGIAVESIEHTDGDVLLEFEITSNRPDALSHLGVAREVAALTGLALKLPPAELNESEHASEEFASVEIQDLDLCPRFSARVIRGVRIGPSPNWLAERLEALGQRSINNVADVTNYVLHEQGHPLHAYDLDKLRGGKIVVRRARVGETIVTLEKVPGGGDEYRERTMTPEMLIIADAESAVGIAGIKGGRGTGISDETTNVLLEAAYFQPAQVRRTARALRLDTDASYRFERGADFGATVRALDRAAALVAEVAGGEVCRGAIDCYPTPVVRTPIPLRRSRVEALVGIRVEFERILEVLRGLGFVVEALADREELLAIAPSYRVDVSIEEDLVEEVARAIGYDSIPATLPGWGGSGNYLANEDRRRGVRSALAEAGFDEAVSFSFVDPELDESLSTRVLDAPDRGVDILNPILEHKPRMRTSLLTGLVEAFETNVKHGTRAVRLFEIGKRFLGGDGERPEERETLGLLVSGTLDDHDFRMRREADFFDIKGAVELVLERLGLTGFTFERARVEYLHPGQASALTIGGEVVGILGRLDPELSMRRKWRQPLFVAELALDRLVSLDEHVGSYKRLPRYPSVVRDVSIVLSRSVPFADIEKAVRSLDVADLAGVALYDIFTGGQIPEDSHSVTLRAVFRSDVRTLTDEEVAASHAGIVEELVRRFGATLRA
jgi:phenylalanyl-tRNA synthetase beta chain